MIKAGSPQWLQIMEHEGRYDLVDTREARLQALTKMVKSYPKASIPEYTFWQCVNQCGLIDITRQEVLNILEAIKK